MLGDLFQLFAAYLRRQVRHIAVTVILLLVGGVLTLLALAMGSWALYLWLQIELGTFAALGILGGTCAVTGVILLAIAFRRSGKNGRVARDIAPAELEATRAPARKRVRRNSRESALLTILITLVVGWIVGRRTRR
jgi:putative superfamily III holin-X